jgi:hypothetical protein
MENVSLQPSSNPSIQEIVQKGNDIYSKIRKDLEPQNNGKYVVIEVGSGEHFTGDTRDEAIAKAKVKFPNVVMFVQRIGGLEKVARISPQALYS